MPSARINITLAGQRLDDAVLALLTRLEVRESDVDPSVVALRFTLNQKPDGEMSPIDDGIFTPAAAIGIELEAPGGTSLHLFKGYLTHVRPHFEGIESNCYLEVLAMDAAVLLDVEDRAASYPNSTDSEAVEEVFKRYSIPVVAETTSARFQEDKQLLIQRATDWSFARQLARRNGFICYLEPDPSSGDVTAFFKPRALGDPPQADLALLREGSNLRWLDLQYVATGPIRYSGSAIDPLDKRLVRGDGTPSLAPLGDALADAAIEQGLKAQAGVGPATALLRDPPPLDAAVTAGATGATDGALFVVEARGELDPALYRGLLRARRPALIKGVGRMFAGIYYVRAVRTTVDDGELTQTFVAQRNATGLSGKESFGQVAEEVPAQ